MSSGWTDGRKRTEPRTARSRLRIELVFCGGSMTLFFHARLQARSSQETRSLDGETKGIRINFEVELAGMGWDAGIPRD